MPKLPDEENQYRRGYNASRAAKRPDPPGLAFFPGSIRFHLEIRRYPSEILQYLCQELLQSGVLRMVEQF